VKEKIGKSVEHEKRMKRCSRCLLPETYPNIRYNEDGVCNYCLTYRPIEYIGEEKLEELLDTYRNRGDKYDCVVAVSGGRDSTYMLYMLTEVFGMRVLAFTYDYGLVSQQAKLNLKMALDALEVDLVTIKHDQTKYFRNNLIALSKKFSPAMVPALCLGCRYGVRGGACKVAMKHKVPLVVFAASQPELMSFKNEFFRTRFNRRSLGMLSELLNNPSYFKPSFIPMYIKDYFHDDAHRYPLSPIFKILYRKVRIIEFFDYIQWDEKKIEDTLKRKLSWEKPKNIKSSWRFDCLVHFFKDYIYLNSVGFTERDELLSNMIREGLISREEALHRLMGQYENLLSVGKEIIDNALMQLNIAPSVLRNFELKTCESGEEAMGEKVGKDSAFNVK